MKIVKFQSERNENEIKKKWDSGCLSEKVEMKQTKLNSGFVGFLSYT